MSIKTWLKEFIPDGEIVKFKDFTDMINYQLQAPKVKNNAIALDKSIRKYNGFLPENLKKHKLGIKRTVVGVVIIGYMDKKSDMNLHLNSYSCHVCAINNCDKCPVANLEDDLCKSIYTEFCESKDPRVIIRSLERMKGKV